MLSALFSDKTLLVVSTFVGMAICTTGIGQVAARGEWAHPLAIVGYVLGALILAIVGAAMFGINLPLVDSPRAALVAMIVLVIVKVVLTRFHHAIA